MNTNYSQWSKFDDENFVAALESSVDRANAVFVNPDDNRKLLKFAEKSRRDLEVYESKDAVEKLKAKGRNRRCQKIQIESNLPPTDLYHDKATEITKNEDSPKLEKILKEFVDSLCSLSIDIDKLQSYTEKKRLHRKGLESALKILKSIELLGSILQRLSSNNLIKQTETAEVTSSLDILLQQVLACSSLFALSCGYFGLAAETSRVLLKFPAYSNESGFWIIRAISFAGMGNAYLCYLHLKTAFSFSPSYPGLHPCILYFEEDLGRLTNFLPCIQQIDLEIKRAIFFMYFGTDNYLVEYPDVSGICIKDIQNLLDFDRIRSNWDMHLSIHSTIDLVNHILAQLSHLDHQGRDNTIRVIIFLAHRLFYEAQTLFLEGCFSSSEIKYIAVASLLTDIMKDITEKGSTDITTKSLQLWLSTLFVNLGMCKYHQRVLSRGEDVRESVIYKSSLMLDSILQQSAANRVELWKSMSALACHRTSFQLNENPVSIWKEIEILVELHRLDEALACLEKLEDVVKCYTETGSTVEGETTVLNNGKLLFSQIYWFGEKSHIFLPSFIDTNRESTEHGEDSSYVETNRINQLLRYILETETASFWSKNNITNSFSPSKLTSMTLLDWTLLLRFKKSYILHAKSKLGIK